MTTYNEFRAMLEQKLETWDDYQKVNNERIAGLKTALERVDSAVDTFTGSYKSHAENLEDRINDLESRAARPAGGGTRAETYEQREHRERFTKWLRNPQDESAKVALRDFENKAVSIGTDAAGGYAVPEQIARDIERHELKFSPVRSLVKVVEVSTAQYKVLLNLRGASSGWVGESDTRSETTTPQLREIAPTFGELYAYPQTTEWALDDVLFNVGDWLAEEVAQEFAVQEGQAVLTGNGTNRPTGMLNTTPVTTDDFASPLRAAAAYEYISSTTATSPAVYEILPDSLIDLRYLVRAQYRANATWVMNSTTAGAVRKLKDSQNRYLWTDGLMAGQPAQLLGHPVVIWEDMQDIGANNFPVAFGDFRRAYVLANRTQVRITVDSNITTPGRIKYFVRRREGGMPLNNDAIKWLRTD